MNVDSLQRVATFLLLREKVFTTDLINNFFHDLSIEQQCAVHDTYALLCYECAQQLRLSLKYNL